MLHRKYFWVLFYYLIWLFFFPYYWLRHFLALCTHLHPDVFSWTPSAHLSFGAPVFKTPTSWWVDSLNSFYLTLTNWFSSILTICCILFVSTALKIAICQAVFKQEGHVVFPLIRCFSVLPRIFTNILWSKLRCPSVSCVSCKSVHVYGKSDLRLKTSSQKHVTRAIPDRLMAL